MRNAPEWNRSAGAKFSLVSTVMVLVLALAPAALSAQQPAPAADDVAYDPALFDALEWENIGPERGGRSQAVAGSAARPFEYWFGATGGGIWKTEDGGTTWEPVADDALESSSVGALAVCPANPDVVYAGMGETELRGNIMQGDGVYRTTDGGETWEHLGLEETQAIGRVRVHPENCDVAYVAALGHPFGPNPERGIFKTTDGGESWEKVLFVNDSTGAVDLSMDPNDPETLYAAFWQVYRKPWKLVSGGPHSGIWKTTDGGETWTELTENSGMPEAPIGKIGVAVSPADPDIVYALIEAEEGGVYRSEDGGESWEWVNDDRKLRQRAFYYTRIYADPEDPNTVYALNTDFYKSVDGGETFPDSLEIDVPHGDNHDLWIAPNNPDRMINANDGGANVSVNGGETWTEQDYPTAQFYHVITTEHTPYHVCGPQQDGSTKCVPSEGWGQLDGSDRFWYAVGGGESGYIAPHPIELDLFFAGSYGGYISAYDKTTGQRRNINAWPINPMGHAAGDIRERFQWTFPIVISPLNPDALYISSQHLWKSTNRGSSWERISPDLTRAVPRTLGPSGGPITHDQTSIEYYATIFTIAPSHHDPDVIWTGSDDGLVHLTRDGGDTWTDVTPPGLPRFTRISLIEASPHNPGTAYVAAHRHRMDDRAPYIYRTHDYGQSWTKIVNGIAPGDYVWAVREDIVRPGMLYAGTEHGVYVSWDDGENWQPLDLNLPDVQVPDLIVEDHDLVIATHGRSFWILEGLDVLRQLSPEVAEANAHLYDPANPVRRVERASVYYYLDEAADSVTLAFLEEDGDVIRNFTGMPEDSAEAAEEENEPWWDRGPAEPSVDAGLNSFTWNMRYPGPTWFEDLIMWSAGDRGPLAPPGVYQVRLSVEGDVIATRSFQALLDPRVEGVESGDLEEQFELAIRIRDRVSEANEAVLLSRGIKQQIDARMEESDAQEVDEAGVAFREALTEVEGEIYQIRNESGQDPLNFPIKVNNQLAALMGVVMSADAAPTAQSYEAFEVLSAELQALLDALDAVIDERLPAYNELLAEHGLDAVERRMLEPDEEEAVAAE